MSRKRGQIAHLNKKRNDNRIENLAFLCLAHHDEFDSQTSQSKNLAKKEVARYREELYEHIKLRGLLRNSKRPPERSKLQTGVFARSSGLDGGANISIFKTKRNWDGRSIYLILGQSFEGTNRSGGPNMGFVNFFSTDNPDHIFEFSDNDYLMLIGPNGDHLIVEEENEFGYFGAGAHFFGEYRKVYSPIANARWCVRSQWVSRFRNGVWPD